MSKANEVLKAIHALNEKELDKDLKTVIDAFAKKEGDKWKAVLKKAWSNGVYPAHLSSDDKAALQRIRNSFGPDWLAKYKG